MKTITLYELLGLIKDGKAPKKIKYFKIPNDEYYEYNKELKDYEDINTGDLLFIDRYNANEIINDRLEILEDEEEFEDIEEIKNDYVEGTCGYEEIETINQLIRNQKKIMERLEK